MVVLPGVSVPAELYQTQQQQFDLDREARAPGEVVEAVVVPHVELGQVVRIGTRITSKLGVLSTRSFNVQRCLPSCQYHTYGI